MEEKSQSTRENGIHPGPMSAISSSSPPDVGLGLAFNDRREFGGLQPLPSNAPTTYASIAMGMVAGHGDDYQAVRFNERVFNQYPGDLTQSRPNYRDHSDTAHHPSWFAGTPDGFQYSVAAAAANVTPSSSEFQNPSYWRHNSIASPGDYAGSFSYDSMGAPTSMNTRSPPYGLRNAQVWPQAQVHAQQPLRRNEQVWPQAQVQAQPVRSMSFGQAESYGQSQNISPYAFQQASIQQVAQMLRPQPPPLDIQSVTTLAQASAPHSAPIMQHGSSFVEQRNAFAAQQQHSPFITTNGVSDPMYPGTVFQESPQLASVQEEIGNPMDEGTKFAVQMSQPG
jgi:hypothetical protein